LCFVVSYIAFGHKREHNLYIDLTCCVIIPPAELRFQHVFKYRNSVLNMPGQTPSLTYVQGPITNWCCNTVSEISFNSLVHGHSFSPAVKEPCVKKSVVARRSKACISVVFTEILCGYFVVIPYCLAPLK